MNTATLDTKEYIKGDGPSQIDEINESFSKVKSVRLAAKMERCGYLIVSVIAIGIGVIVQQSAATDICIRDMLHRTYDHLLDCFNWLFQSVVAEVTLLSVGNCSFIPTKYPLYSYANLFPALLSTFITTNACSNETCSPRGLPAITSLIPLNPTSCNLCNYAQFISSFISNSCDIIQPVSCPPEEPVQSIVRFFCRKT